MQYDEKKALSAVRLEHAKECLGAAKSLQNSENYKSAANRSYYAIFHAMRAVLAFDGIDMKHHSGVISEFRKLYIKTNIFDIKLSQIISVLFDIRTESDYDDFFIISKSEVQEQIENAEYFLNRVKTYKNNYNKKKTASPVRAIAVYRYFCSVFLQHFVFNQLFTHLLRT